MNKEQIKTLLAHLAEEEFPPSGMSMWPGIQKHFASRKNLRFHKGFFIRRLPVYAQVVISLSLFIIFGTLILFATPQGHTLAEAVADYFTRAESDYVPREDLHFPTIPVTMTPDPDITATITPDPDTLATMTPEPGFTFDLTVSKAAEMAGYDVLEPTWLPEVLYFVGASYQSDQEIVRIFYQYNPSSAGFNDAGNYQGNGLVLREEHYQRTEDCELCGLVGASAEIEKVRIGDAIGEYVVGVWYLNDGATWKNDPWLLTLRWQIAGRAFELMFFGPPEEITKEDMIAIAESLK